MLYVEVMYHFNEIVDFKISSKLIQASKDNLYMLVPSKCFLVPTHSQHEYTIAIAI